MVANLFSFDGTINTGQIVTAVSILGGGFLVLTKMLNGLWGIKTDVQKAADTMQRFEKRLDGVDAELKNQTKILVAIGEQGARLVSLETQVATLHQQLYAVMRPRREDAA